VLYSSLVLGESQAFIISLVYIYMDDANMNPAPEAPEMGAEGAEEAPEEAPAMEGGEEAPAEESAE
jgi:hypothetical protein